MTNTENTLTLPTYLDAMETRRNLIAIPGMMTTNPVKNENGEWAIEVIS